MKLPFFWAFPVAPPFLVAVEVGATFAVKETSNVSAAEAMGKSEAMVALRLVTWKNWMNYDGNSIVIVIVLVIVIQ